MHTHPADAKLSRYGARPDALLVHRSNLLDRHGRLAALVDPVRLGSLDTSLLALSYEAPFEFGDHAQYRDQDRTGDIGCRELRLIRGRVPFRWLATRGVHGKARSRR